jgi:hypothetical protein
VGTTFSNSSILEQAEKKKKSSAAANILIDMVQSYASSGIIRID